MDQSTRDGITWTLGTFITAITIIAMATRYILFPWLREHLVTPVEHVRHQVTENHHRSETPTIPDRLEDLAAGLEEAVEAHATQSKDIAALSRVLDEHLRWSDRWVDVTDRELQLVKDQLARYRTENPE